MPFVYAHEYIGSSLNIAGRHIPNDMKSFSSDGHRDTSGSITHIHTQKLKVKHSVQKDILFLFRVRVCRLGILGRMTVSGSMLLSKINSSKSPNTAKPSNDLRQSKFLFTKHNKGKLWKLRLWSTKKIHWVTCNEFDTKEYLATTSRFLCIKITECNVKKFSYNEYSVSFAFLYSL